MAFVSDAASVLKKAYVDALKPVCTNAKWVACMSHALNTVAKSVVEEVDDKVTAGILHPKQQAARRRKWSVCCKPNKYSV